jgi:hypothetical protein
MCALAKHSPFIHVHLPRSSRSTIATGVTQQTHTAASAARSESSSVLARAQKGQESTGVGYKAGKSDTPHKCDFRNATWLKWNGLPFSFRGSRFAWRFVFQAACERFWRISLTELTETKQLVDNVCMNRNLI